MAGDWDAIDNEMMLEGPTGTGKSVLLGALMKYLLRTYPGISILVMRRVKADLGGSFMQMWENEILDWNDQWDRNMLQGANGVIPSHRSREVYSYPNGSKLWCRGMDMWARVKSMAYDVIWPMEMTEFTEDQIEGLMTRLRARRGIKFPKRFLIGDVNPDHPKHWANQRAIRGVSRRITTTLQDNPGYWDRQNGVWRPPGLEYITNLKKRLRGANAQRYINGEWVAATGQILDWDESRHVFHGRVARNTRTGVWQILMEGSHPVLGEVVDLIGFGAAYDWGDVHAGTLQVWGVDKEGRQYLVEEVYHSKRPPMWWADWAVRFWKKYGLQFIVCDNAAKDSITFFNKRLEEEGGARARIAVPCDKRSGNREQSNMEVLRDLYCDQRDGKPGVFVRANALAHAPDMAVAARCLADEIPGYVYAEYDTGRHKGRPEDRPDRTCVDDGLDACTYFRVHVLGGRRVIDKTGEPLEPQSLAEKMNAHYWKDVA